MKRDDRATLVTPGGFDGYVGACGNFTSLTKIEADGKTFDVDAKFQTELMEVLRKDFPETFGKIADYRPPGKVVLPIKIGIVQDVLLKDALLPEFVGGPLEQAHYPILQKERFFAESSLIALNAKPKRTDITIDWGTVIVHAHAREAASERREQLAASFGANLDILAYKADVLDDQLGLEEEIDTMRFMTDPANYDQTGTSNVKSVGGGEFWNDFTTPSDPVSLIFDYKENLRTKARLTGAQMQELIFWMGNSVFSKLMRHPKLIAIASVALFGAGRVNLDFPVDEAFIATLFNMSIGVGRAGYAAKVNGPIVDVWGNVAGIVYTGGAEVISPRFGFDVTSEGYPSAMDYFDPTPGTKGADVVKLADAWNPSLTNSSAGVLFTTPLQ